MDDNVEVFQDYYAFVITEITAEVEDSGIRIINYK